MKVTQGEIVSAGHVVLTGPITGQVTLEDGTVVDVSGPAVEVSGQEEADEITFLIGEHWVENGHPDDVEFDDDPKSKTFGQMVQRPFVHVHPKKFDKHPRKFSGKPAGVARKG